MAKRKSSDPSPAPKTKTEQVTILVGRHNGVSCTPLFYNADTVLVIVNGSAYVYRLEDVERVG